MYNIIPVPQKVKMLSGTVQLEFLRCFGNPLSEASFSDFVSFCTFAVENTQDKKSANLIFVKSDLPAEGYCLSIKDKITVEYSTAAGAFYALQTLKQIILSSSSNAIECTVIEDYPKYAYRGFMLDVGRYFYTVAQVKHFIDSMALHKLNAFHFHLTEDQGWRIEIKKYPLLIQKGSKRSHTNFGIKPQSGYYTQNDIKEIVAYAHERFIKVIPEFDIPGHTASALACYPYLGCFDRKMAVKTHWGVKHDILCAGKDSTYQFVFDVLDELMPLFPDKIIHIGGDEANKARWDICPRCKKKIEDNNLSGSEELQQYFMSQVNRYLEKHGYSSVMWNWDSIEPTKHLDPSIAWTLCGGDENSRKTAMRDMDNGRKIINTCSDAFYLDLPYAWISLEKTADFDPDLVSEKGSSDNFLGIEAPLWTEYVPNMKKAEYMTYPRLGAFAVAAWSPAEAMGYNNFLPMLNDYYKLLRHCNIGYAELHECMPSSFRAKCGSLWFNRRQLHWQGLHNLIEDAIVKRKYSEK